MSILIKIDSIKKLYKKIILYKESISKYTSNNKILDNLNLIDTAIHSEILQNINFKISSIDEIFSIWHQIQLINNLFKLILNDLENSSIINNNKFYYDIDNIKLDLINSQYSSVILQYNKYKNITNQNDIIIINEISDQVFSKLIVPKSSIIINTVYFLTNLVKKFIYSVNLYAFIMQKLINDCDSLDKYECDYILNQVEIIKDFILLHDKKIHYSDLQKFQSNAHLKSFGFIYFQESASLKTIIKKFLPTQNSNTSISVDNLNSIAQKNSCRIIIINRVIKNSIEFNLDKLIDKNIANSYKHNKNMGINQILLDKFDTIKFNKPSIGKKWNFNIDSYGSESSDFYWIVENINNSIYQVLTINTNENIIKLHKSKIPEFIEYIKNKGIIATHSRVTEYNNIHEKICLTNLFLPVKFSLESIKIKSQKINSNDLRYSILVKFEKQFTKIFNVKFKNGSKLHTYKDLSELFHDIKFADIFTTSLLNQYTLYELNYKNDSEFEIFETLTTFLSSLFELTIDFRRLYHDVYINSDIDINILVESNEIKYKKLLVIFMTLSESVLLRIITDSKNIYQNMIYKNEILNLNLY
jgi:hypothetical protein